VVSEIVFPPSWYEELRERLDRAGVPRD